MRDVLTLKKSNCKNCYKCVRVCPVKAIRVTANQAHIINEECILCGQCVMNCPQQAKEIVSEVEKAKVYILSGAPVIVSLAPSFIANFGVGIETMRKTLKKLGFADVEETAVGATIVKREYERILKEEEQDVLITSCCHSVNLLIQKHFPKALPYLANVLSPMQAHCVDIKKRYPEARTVFVGPCLSKKEEAQRYAGIVDAALTFDELTEWLKEENISIEEEALDDPAYRARFFPVPGGVMKSMTEFRSDYQYIQIDGLDACMRVLSEVEKGELHHCFIEMNACIGACIGGPAMEKGHTSSIGDYIAVAKYAGTKDFDVIQPEPAELRKSFEYLESGAKVPTEAEIAAAMRKMGKHSRADELNCGTCGYNSCREKAIAICQGKAEPSMCLPFLKESSVNFSDGIFKNSPVGIIVINENLEVQQINSAGQKILNIRSESDIKGENIVRVMDPDIFFEVMDSKKIIRDRRIYMPEYERYVNITVFGVDDNQYVALMKDITEDEKNREQSETVRKQTVEVADKVIDKQMRIVQEIASLLGETAAETKIALTKLKESIKDE